MVSKSKKSINTLNLSTNLSNLKRINVTITFLTKESKLRNQSGLLIKLLQILRPRFKELSKTLRKIFKLSSKLPTKYIGLLFNSMKKTTLIFLKRLPKSKFSKCK